MINNDNRLSNLGVLEVEAQLAKTIDMDGAIDDFAVRNARRKTLDYFKFRVINYISYDY
jgi:hypothetical protein